MPDQSEIQLHELFTSSSSTCLSPTGTTGPRKLSKRKFPASTYVESHITDIHHSSLLCFWKYSLHLDKHLAKFQLRAEDDDGADDNYNSYPSDDERGLEQFVSPQLLPWLVNSPDSLTILISDTGANHCLRDPAD